MNTTETIDNTADLIDSRDVIARIEALEGEREALSAARDEAMTELGTVNEALTFEDTQALAATLTAATEALTDWDTEHMPELASLIELAKEASDYAADWQYGETLIRDSYFETYAQELAEDCDMVPKGLTWPMTCIDWAEAARELQQDYTSVEFGGVTYWIR